MARLRLCAYSFERSSAHRPAQRARITRFYFPPVRPAAGTVRSTSTVRSMNAWSFEGPLDSFVATVSSTAEVYCYIAHMMIIAVLDASLSLILV